MIGQELAEIITDDFADFCPKSFAKTLEVVYWSPDRDAFMVVTTKKYSPKAPNFHRRLAEYLEAACFYRGQQHGGIHILQYASGGFQEVGVLDPSDEKKAEFDRLMEASQ